jgi:hypothetical protein
MFELKVSGRESAKIKGPELLSIIETNPLNVFPPLLTFGEVPFFTNLIESSKV